MLLIATAGFITKLTVFLRQTKIFSILLQSEWMLYGSSKHNCVLLREWEKYLLQRRIFVNTVEK